MPSTDRPFSQAIANFRELTVRVGWSNAELSGRQKKLCAPGEPAAVKS
jgi:hypothetical protein